MREAIFITGGGSGIGRAVAQRFAREGWFIGLADIDESGLAETAALLPQGASWTTKLDVQNRAAWDQALAAFVQASGGRLDVLFNNAGVAHGGPFEGNSQAEIDQLIDVNFRGVAYGAQAAFPYLRDTRSSVLLNTASAAALYGGAGLAVYSATKFAVRALTEALDVEWAGDGIAVRSLMPGFIDTPLLHTPAHAGSNQSKRDTVVEAGLEFTPVEVVAETAWEAIRSPKLHHLVGKTARRLAFAARWMPGRLRKTMVRSFGVGK
ncbi:SDR family oxidoreductase [Novosphingobium sp. Gsoil 351]|uniref:SDR family oxidoreductase n=1 Tax=Novosphingobium sp. Gsoil 351 TaxID=2675225 RepID=UPI0012B48235|nr:SDR family oxidoreductase [Novosphingobium sp. Gsoil 351]QGN55311.1 SDR family oxidoreductase [Novosphingobium sp. Gsoil 351]